MKNISIVENNQSVIKNNTSEVEVSQKEIISDDTLEMIIEEFELMEIFTDD